MNRGHWLGIRCFRGVVFVGVLMVLAQGCTGLQYGEYVTKYGRPLSDPVTPPVSVTIEPSQHTSPIKTQQTFTAFVKDAKGNPVYSTVVEWILARANGAVGDIIEVGQDPLKRALKVDNTYAIGGADRRGESTITITSVQEGTTHLIAVVPDIENKSKHKAFAVMNWLDAEWEFSQDAAEKVGTARTLTTTVRKASTGSPLEGYQVKWNVTAGPEAYFEESGQPEAITVTDANGVSHVRLTQRTPGPGGNAVHINVIKPEKPGHECCPAVSGVIAKGVTNTTWMAPAISLEQQCPSAIVLGDVAEFPIILTNTSKVDASNVVLRETIPTGMEFLGSNPQAQLSGNTLTWKLADLPAQASRQVIVRMKAATSGSYVNEVLVQASDGVQSQSMCTVSVGEPILSLSQTCPSKVNVGSPAKFSVTVTNTGSGDATNVRISDVVPKGMTHGSGKSEITRDIGILSAGSTATEVFTFTAKEPGSATNIARATGGTNLKEEVRCDITIEKPSIAIKKSGPEKRFLGTTATYTIEVSNPGSAATSGVFVRDTLPNGFTFESSTPPGNRQANSNEVSWNLGTIAPGESKTLQVTGRAVSEGRHCNGATVKTETGLEERAEACTTVTGVAALLLEVTDNLDPVEVGTQTTYSIVVTNQGTANATNIKISATIPDGMDYVSSTGSTARLVVVGKLVDFDPVPVLKPKETLTFTVTVKGIQAGDLRFRVEMNGDQLTSPVLEEESTKLYQ